MNQLLQLVESAAPQLIDMVIHSIGGHATALLVAERAAIIAARTAVLAADADAAAKKFGPP